MSPASGPARSAGAGAAGRRCGAWALESRHGPASELLAWEEPPAGTPRQARLHAVDRPALVLGSAQRAETADRDRAAAAGVEVVRRRSGGGAVLVEPDRQVWADFIVPAGDPLWRDDISQAVAWVGELWSSVVASFVAEPPAVFTGRLAADRWGRLVCFAGAGPGEVFVADRKLVGVSQRRNRHRALIQTMARLGVGSEAHLSADQAQPAGAGRGRRSSELEFLALAQTERAAGRAALSARVGALPASAAAVTAALLSALEAQDWAP